MATTYTPAASDASYPSFAGVAFDDPQAYSSHDNKRVDAKYFLKPVQDELLKHQQVLAEGVLLRVSNKTGGTITAGTLVYVSAYDGATNSLPEVAKADADSRQATHVVTADITDGSTGTVAAAGVLTGLDTSAYAEDDVIYLSATAGAYTSTAPTGDNQLVQRVGIVQVSDAVNGSIFFHPGFADVEKPWRRVKANLSASNAPGVNDDSSAGYAVGSPWIDTTADKAYICLDASVGAAVWAEITGGGSSLPVDDTTSLVQDPADPTKQVRIDAGNVQTGTVRTITMPDQDVDLTPDATFKGASSAPTAHASSHENGGSDEINVAGLSGVLADPQTPAAHASSHKGGGSDPIDIATTSVDGLMSSSDKSKLDGIDPLVAQMNLCLNPGFETILPGSHTDAIRKLIGTATPSDVDQNSLFPAWQLFALSAGTTDEVYCYEETGTVNDNSLRAAKLTSGAGSATRGLMQEWSSGEHLNAFVAQCLGKYFNLAMDVKLSAGLTSGLPEIFITTDGTGGTTTTAAYPASTTSWQRLFVSVQVPSDATYIKFGFRFTSTVSDYYLDNAAVAVTDSALSALPYRPRGAVSLYAGRDYAWDISAENPGDTSYHSTTSSKGDINGKRPAWANYVWPAVFCPSVNANWVAVKPSDWTAHFAVGAYPGGESHGPCAISADGEIEYKTATSGDLIYLSWKGWEGEGL